MANIQKIKKYHTRYGKLIKKIMACSEKRKALQAMKKNVRKLIDETR